MKADVDVGRSLLDPGLPGNVCDKWIRANLAQLAHSRAAVLTNPFNTWTRHPDGSFGRGTQYPFKQTGTGEYISVWNADRLEPCESVGRQLLRH